MYGHPFGKCFKRAPHVWEKKKWCIFGRQGRVQSQLFEISQCRHVRDRITQVQVTIFMKCLNFAGGVSRILLHSVSSCHRVIPSRKNRIEFRWGNKLPGTRSEALITCKDTSNIWTCHQHIRIFYWYVNMKQDLNDSSNISMNMAHASTLYDIKYTWIKKKFTQNWSLFII